MQRWLVTGSSGQLGGHLVSLLRTSAATAVRCLPRPSDAPSLRAACEDFAPTHVVHLAAVSSPAAVAAAPDAARWVNVDAAEVLAEHAARTGAWMLLSSSDWVYDGDRHGLHREDEVCRPTTTYGRMKLQAEERVLGAADATVARFSLMCGLPVVGDDGRTRATTWTTVRQRLLAGGSVSAATDEVRTPLSFVDAATAVVGLAGARFRGVVNVGGPLALTPWDVFTALAASVGAVDRVDRVLRTSLHAGHERPRNVALETSRLTGLMGPGAVRSVSLETFTPPPPTDVAARHVELPTSSALLPA